LSIAYTQTRLIYTPKDMSSSVQALDGLGARLGDVVSATKLSQREFASQIPCSLSFLSSMLRGEKLPGAEVLASLRARFGISIDWLLDGQGTMFSSAHFDLDRLRLSISLIELARRQVVDNDVEANALVVAILEGTERIEDLTPAAFQLISDCETARQDLVFAAVLHQDLASVMETQEWAAATLRSASAHLKLTRPIRIQKAAVRTSEAQSPRSPAGQTNTGINVRAAMGNFIESVGGDYVEKKSTKGE